MRPESIWARVGRPRPFDDSAWSTADGLFHRATGDGSVTWVGNNNRTQPQDFGFSPSTNNARGASLGEIGGYLERFPAAWYADTDIGTFDLATDDLSASVTWLQNGLKLFSNRPCTTWGGRGTFRNYVQRRR